jgi:hypothetical protein
MKLAEYGRYEGTGLGKLVRKAKSAHLVRT